MRSLRTAADRWAGGAGRKRPASRGRRGFALIAVLWTVAGLSISSAVMLVVVRGAADAAANRIWLARSEWLAEGCLAHARHVIDAALRLEGDVDRRWATLDALPVEPRGRECTVTLEPVGLKLDVGAADEVLLRRVVETVGGSAERSTHLLDALLDWADADDTARQGGAESAWYAGMARLAPRNAPVANVEELALIRGWAEEPRLRGFLTTDPGRVLLTRAPVELLQSLPGMNRELAHAFRSLGPDVTTTLDAVHAAAAAAPASRERLLANFAALSRVATAVPDAWLLTARVAKRGSGLGFTRELRLVRAPGRAAVTRVR
jgi:hypothetical protein